MHQQVFHDFEMHISAASKSSRKEAWSKTRIQQLHTKRTSKIRCATLIEHKRTDEYLLDNENRRKEKDKSLTIQMSAGTRTMMEIVQNQV